MGVGAVQPLLLVTRIVPWPPTGGRADAHTADKARPVMLRRTEGSAIRRIGWTRWRRNLAVGLGNAWRESGAWPIAQALSAARDGANALVQEHIDWALSQRADAA